MTIIFKLGDNKTEWLAKKENRNHLRNNYKNPESHTLHTDKVLLEKVSR